MNYSQDITASGVPAENLAKHLAALAPVLAKLREKSLPLLTIPADLADLKEIESVTERIRQQADTLVVLGTGGSSLGGQMLVALKQSPFKTPKVRVLFVDNSDPHTLELMLGMDLARCYFLVISKSGGTPETVVQSLLVREALAQKKLALKDHMAVISVADRNPLHALAKAEGLAFLPHDPKLGGRFSVLSSVGLLPASLAGLDIKALRVGAQSVIEAMGEKEFAPAVGAALQFAQMEAGRNIQVLMPYADRLRLLGAWYKQIWAESLGKNGKGSTAATAVGAVDQHSQLQLYLDGPDDKLLTFIQLNHKGKGPKIRGASEAYLEGKTPGDLIDAQQRATAKTLIKRGRPVRVMKIDEADEKSVGALLMHFMLETILTAQLLGVDPYDQPAVEGGKVLAREYLVKA